MKRNDIRQLQQHSLAELQEKLTDFELRLRRAKLERGAGRLANMSLVSNLGDDMARIKTVLTQRTQAQEESAE